MSSDWEDGEQQQEDSYRSMWENVDNNDWNFDNAPADWSVWDEPPGADRTFNDFDPLYGGDSSSTVDNLTPPRHSHTFEDAQQRLSRPRGSHRATSLARMGNTTSTSHHHRPSYSELPAARESQQRTNPQRRVPSHSEDWLDRSATGDPSSFIPDHLFETLPDSSEAETPAHSPPSLPEQSEDNMPATTRRRGQHNSVVDLTTGPSSPREPAPRPRSLKRAAQDAEASRSTKKSKKSPPQQIDELDLTNEAPSTEEELRQAQQEKAIAAQQADQEPSGPLKIGKRQCIICMESYTNATVTHCGHIYCHECLTQALIAGEKNSERSIGNCPVCRKPVNRKKASQMIPLAFMKKSTFKGKGRKDMKLIG